MMISMTSSNRQPASPWDGSLYVLEPPRHAKFPHATLSSGKHLIGSDPSCAIQIVAEGVHSRHALVIVGQQKVVLKALDPRTWVNDNPVTESVLRIGDRVSIGPITFRLRHATANEIAEFQLSIAEESPPALAPNLPPAVPAELNRPPEVASEQLYPTIEIPGSDAEIPPIAVSVEQVEDVEASETVIETEPVCETTTTQPVINDLVINDLEVADSSAPVIEPLHVESGIQPVDPWPTIASSTVDAQSSLPIMAETWIPVAIDQDDRSNASQRSPTAEKTKPEPSEDLSVASRYNELRQLAVELDRRTAELQLQTLQLSEREAEFERKQAGIAAENDQSAAAMRAARNELAAEQARQTAAWNEWNATHRSSTDALNAQLESLQQRRAEIQAANDQAALDRAELQRLQQAYDFARSDLTAERNRLNAEREAFLAERDELEVWRQKQLREFQERESLIDEDRRTLVAAQTDMLGARQQLELEFARQATECDRLCAERADLQAATAEFADQRQTDLLDGKDRKASLDEERRALVAAQAELLAARQQVEQEFNRQATERDHLRSERETLRTQSKELEALRQQRSADFRERESRIDEERRALARAQSELFTSRQQLELDRTKLAAERTTDSSRCEQEFKDLADQRSRLHEDEAAISKLRADLQAGERDLAERRRELNRQFEELEVSRTEFESFRAEQSRRATGDDSDNSTGHSGDNAPSRFDVAPTAGSKNIESEDRPVLRPHADFQSIRASALAAIPESTFDETSSGFQESYPTGIPDPLSPTGHVESGAALARLGTGHKSQNYASLMEATEATKFHLNSISDFRSDVVEQDLDAASRPTTVSEPAFPNETLSEVNHRFGLPVSTTESLLNSLAGYDDCRETTADFTRETAEGGSENSSFDSPPAEDSPRSILPVMGNSISSLRAQLAQMFELPEDPSRSKDLISDLAASRRDPRTDDPVLVETPRVDSNQSIERDRLSVVADQTDPSTRSSSSSNDVSPVASECETISAQGADVPTQEDQPEDPWMRRLRELSMVAQGDSQPPSPAASTPQPQSEPTPEGKSAEPAATEDDEEYSVEAQLARLLGRTKTAPKKSVEIANASIPDPGDAEEATQDLSEADSSSAVDLSHLSEEPKHRQNKNAVREEVQSFRAVAQMSARTALAKHSWNHLRTQIYFKIGLTAIATGATIWFGGTYLYGSEAYAWKSLTCAIAMLACFLNLVGASSQLKTWRRRNSSEAASRRRRAPDDSAGN